ncbi:hypothetical protein FACS1894184_06130 [Clostridia bacterium]|nr:hypothetical protein FACS1894184_06130 [Clostridia bacterium]
MSKNLKPAEYKETLDQILALIVEQGKQQKDMCQFIGISQNVVNRWKAGESVSFVQYTDKLAKYLGVSADYLLGSTD